MKFSDLLDHFEGRTVLPIDLSEVADWIKARGVIDEIFFVGVDMNPGVLRGHLYRYQQRESVYGEMKDIAEIYYGKDHPKDWINFVCAKELLHLAATNNHVTNKADLETLIRRLALPVTIESLKGDPPYVVQDKLVVAAAIALLFPLAARDLILPEYHAGRLNLEDIARIAMIPANYVAAALTDDWPEIVKVVKASAFLGA